jgi:C-terminal processing protease CtpA/Prc
VYGLKNGAGLVLTVARYVTPSGNDIQGIGINPDISGKSIVPLPLPVMGTDTSRIDFNDVRSRLGPSMCQLPEEHGRSQ